MITIQVSENITMVLTEKTWNEFQAQEMAHIQSCKDWKDATEWAKDSFK